MSGDDTARLVAAGLMIALVASSLFGRGLKLGATLRMVLAWCAIFAIVFVAFLFRDEARVVWSRIKAEVGGETATVSGGVTRVTMRADGHFHVLAKINGQAYDFLIDTGATSTGLTERTARQANVQPDSSIQMPVDTANGTVMVSTARIGLLEVGNVRQTDARAVIGKSFGDTNVLGMNFLSQLKSWKVEGRTLTLEP
ncbi:TIGR02281 family clan AA aspartic protease [Sphingomonas sp. SUN039]|uniref:retropepsin-like aspartic protease family protein n=1 Tax=Sphingomonas sp. SUN039 TaxID=2937787 RepID=UPI002164E335|nr:TIGR02281 family clan AA aspartic protease [Sphingomonas sp. SUN039]UVO53505.1 TIGR02281 family clan AA aspartic protease [Sphingomonas sp. SUN039]